MDISEYFKAAVYEDNPELRLQKLIEGCKAITDVLPFPEKNENLLEEEELIQYLLLCVPLFGNSLDQIIRCFIDMLKNNNIFLLKIWNAFEFIGTINEKASYSTHSSPINKKKTIKKIKDNSDDAAEIKGMLRQMFCAEVMNSMIAIKLKALEYMEIIINYFVKKEDFSRLRQFNGIELLKIFLVNSLDSSVLIQATKLISILAEIEDSQFKKAQIEEQINEILLMKYSLQNRSRHSRKVTLNFAANDFKTEESQASLSNINEDGDGIGALDLSDDKSNSSSDASDDNEESVEKKIKAREAEKRDYFKKQVESWLCTNDKPLVFQNEYVASVFRTFENVSYVLSWIFKPFETICTSCWLRKYPELNLTSAIEYLPGRVKKNNQSPLYKAINGKFLNTYYMRSFMVATAMSDQKNYRYVINVTPQLLDIFCKFFLIFRLLILLSLIYLSLINKYIPYRVVEETYNFFVRNNGACNLNHVSMLMMAFLRREPSTALNYIMHYNIPLFLIEDVDFDIVRTLLLMIVVPSSLGASLFHDDLRNIFWRYLKYTNFFPDLALKMLLNQSMAKEKLNMNYKPFDASSMIKISTVAVNDDISIKFEDTNPSTLNNADKTNTDYEKAEYTLTEDRLGIKNVDIDQLKDALVQKRRFKSFKGVVKLMTGVKKTFSSKSSLTHQKSDSFSPSQGNPPGSLKESMISPRAQNGQELPSDMSHSATVSENNGGSKSNRPYFANSNPNSPLPPAGFGRNQLLISPHLINIVNPLKLEELYPNSTKMLSPNSLWFETKQFKNANEFLVEMEETSSACADLLHILILDIVTMHENKKFRESINLPCPNVVNLLTCMFEDSDCTLFNSLIKNYLLKIYLALTQHGSSSESCGIMVNMLVEYSMKANHPLNRYNKLFQRILRGYFDYLIVLIVNIYAIDEGKTIITQKNKVTSPISPNKELIIKTFRLALENDKRFNYSLLDEIHETCWHALFLMFFKIRTNSIVHKEILKIFKVAFTYGNEKSITNLFFKLNVLPSFYSVIMEIYKNSVVEHKNNAEEYFLNLKIFFEIMIKCTQRSDCPNLSKRILSMQSFLEVKNVLTIPIFHDTKHTTLTSASDSEQSPVIIKKKGRENSGHTGLKESNGSSGVKSNSISKPKASNFAEKGESKKEQVIENLSLVKSSNFSFEKSSERSQNKSVNGDQPKLPSKGGNPSLPSNSSTENKTKSTTTIKPIMIQDASTKKTAKKVDFLSESLPKKNIPKEAPQKKNLK